MNVNVLQMFTPAFTRPFPCLGSIHNQPRFHDLFPCLGIGSPPLAHHPEAIKHFMETRLI